MARIPGATRALSPSASSLREHLPASHGPAAIDTIKAELADALRRIEPVLEVANDEPMLLMPGHHPVVRPAFRPRKGMTGWLRPARVYEEASTVLLSYLLSRLEIAVFFDIGSARGHFTRIAASRIARPPKVFSFEMRPDTVEIQRRLLENDPFGHNAVVCDMALTDCHVGGTRVWTVRSSLFEELPPPSAYREAWHRRLKYWVRRDRTRGLSPADVVLTSLDAFSHSAAVVPDLLKIDVDGYEMKVLKGASEILSKNRPALMLELHRDSKQRHAATRKDVARYLFDLGYRSLLLTDHQDRLTCSVEEIGIDHAGIAKQETNLLLFVHRSSRLPRHGEATALRVVGGRA